MPSRGAGADTTTHRAKADRVVKMATANEFGREEGREKKKEGERGQGR